MLYMVTEKLVKKSQRWASDKGKKGTLTYTFERTTHRFLGIRICTSDIIKSYDFVEDV